MKRMVDDFRDYARVPPARLSPLALNTLVEEVAALYGAEVSDWCDRAVAARRVCR